MRIKYKDAMYKSQDVVRRYLSISYDNFLKCRLPLITEVNKNGLAIRSYFLDGHDRDNFAVYIAEAEKIKFSFPNTVPLPMGCM